MIKDPVTYAAHIKNSIPNVLTDVVDIFAVPDYTEMFKGCGDKLFGCYAKKDQTQLQFIFESVPTSVFFPTGVKVLYRAFASEEIIVLKREANRTFPTVNVNPYKVLVESYPKQRVIKITNPTTGMEEEQNVPAGVSSTFVRIVRSFLTIMQECSY